MERSRARERNGNRCHSREGGDRRKREAQCKGRKGGKRPAKCDREKGAATRGKGRSEVRSAKGERRKIDRKSTRASYARMQSIGGTGHGELGEERSRSGAIRDKSRREDRSRARAKSGAER
jgi:hypothetical protein